MDNRLKKLNDLQDQAVTAILESGTRDSIACSILVVTAFGKTFVKFKLLYKLLELGWLKKHDTVWYWAEVAIRSENVNKEAVKFFNIYGVNPLIDFNFEFVTYQGQKTGDRVIDLYDEFDFAMTAKYSQPINNSTAKYRVGFSGTVEETSSIFRDKLDYTQVNNTRQSNESTKKGEITDFINKGQLTEILLPVVFEYHLQDAIEDGILAEFQTTIINHEMAREGELKIWKSYDRYGSEYDWYMAREKQRMNYSLPLYRKQSVAREQSRFLWRLPSKIEVVRNLVNRLEGKTILFGVENSLLEMITPHVVKTLGDNFVYREYAFSVRRTKGVKYYAYNMLTTENKEITSRLYKEYYDKYVAEIYRDSSEIISDFESGKINVIGSSKKISRGATLSGLRNAIFVSYYSTNTDASQKLGRLLRHDGYIKNLFIIKTLDTFEEKWFNGFTKIKDYEGNVKRELNLNIINEVNSKRLLQ